MELRGISVGILVLVTLSVLVFGKQLTRKILIGVALLVVLTIGGTVGVAIWEENHKIRVQGADGVIHEFPAGTSTDVIDRVMKEYAPARNGPGGFEPLDPLPPHGSP